jgi:hypothetical protein
VLSTGKIAQWCGVAAMAVGLVLASQVAATADDDPRGPTPERECKGWKGRIDEMVATGPGGLSVAGRLAGMRDICDPVYVTAYTAEVWDDDIWVTRNDVGSTRLQQPDDPFDFSVRAGLTAGADSYAVCLHETGWQRKTLDCYRVEVGREADGMLKVPVVHGRIPKAPANWGNGGDPHPSCGFC